MKGKGGPENSSCNYRGVIAKIREPMGERLWLGTYENVVDAIELFGLLFSNNSIKHLFNSNSNKL